MSNMDQSLYRPCVGVMLINRDGLVFVGRRKASRREGFVDHPWQMPQGGIDQGEQPAVAALRELYEETNVRSVTALAEAPDWYSYDIPAGLGKTGRNWRGQTQKWFALRFDGEDREINVLDPGDGRHPAEFSSWRWVKADELAELVVPFKQDVYRQVIAAFKDFVRS